MKPSEAMLKGRDEDGERLFGELFKYDTNGKIIGCCAYGYILFSILTPEERNQQYWDSVCENASADDLIAFVHKRGVEMTYTQIEAVIHMNDREKLPIEEIAAKLDNL